MDTITQLLDIFLHLDVHLRGLSETLGPWLYVILFLIIFCETGLVVTPFLPGDSLLFAAGALAALDDSPLSVMLLIGILLVAAVTGDAVNYLIGYRVGPKVFKYEHSRLFNKRHLIQTQRFYEEYGAMTIILARFIPIIRTFAPFVAGIGKMEYRKFCVYNVAGGVAWVVTFLLGGYFLGSQDVVKRNFHIVIVAIIIVSILPAVIKFILVRRKRPVEERIPIEVE
jgi:membrane-associated protein